MNESESIRALVWLSTAENLTPRGRRLLMDEYGDAARALAGFGSNARALIGDRAYRELNEAGEGLERTFSRLRELDIRALAAEDDGFPERLRKIPDAPDLLYMKGEYNPRPAVAIVGSRRDTRYGREMARRISRDLAEAGVVIVSGLARGIDTAAHQGAVQAEGVSIGVLGCGLDAVYPRENQELSQSMLSLGGCLLSEYPPSAQPLPYHFPHRNRLISGLADAVLLIEATLRSGTQSTVNHALEQGRTVFALPGNVDAPGSELPLRLLKDGAEMCTCASDILSGLRLPERSALKETVNVSEALPADDPILRALEREEKTFEELLEETSLPAAALTAQLSLLELEGNIERRPGRAYALLRT